MLPWKFGSYGHGKFVEIQLFLLGLPMLVWVVISIIQDLQPEKRNSVPGVQPRETPPFF